MLTLLNAFAFGSKIVSAQFTIKIPKIRIQKPDKDESRIKDMMTTTTTTIGKTNPQTSDSKLIYTPMRPTNVPVFLKNSIYVQTVAHDEYWKMKGQRDFSSWMPKIRFNQFYNEEKVLNYTVDYSNPDGSPWYSENLESSGRNAGFDAQTMRLMQTLWAK